MPPPTHGAPGSGLLPFKTLRAAIGRIPRGTSHHDPESAKKVDELPYSPDQPFDKTILCKNSDIYHWSGLRRFTNREIAGIQGFPLSYRFEGSTTEVQKQIGNAVPPPYFEHVFQECIKVLREVDRKQRRQNIDDGIDEKDVVVLDEEEASVDMELDDMALPSSQRFVASSGNSSSDAIVIDDDNYQDVIVLE